MDKPLWMEETEYEARAHWTAWLNSLTGESPMPTLTRMSATKEGEFVQLETAVKTYRAHFRLLRPKQGKAGGFFVEIQQWPPSEGGAKWEQIGYAEFRKAQR